MISFGFHLLPSDQTHLFGLQYTFKLGGSGHLGAITALLEADMMVWSSCCRCLSISWLRNAMAIGVLELTLAHASDQARDATTSFILSSLGTRAVFEAGLRLLLLW